MQYCRIGMTANRKLPPNTYSAVGGPTSSAICNCTGQVLATQQQIYSWTIRRCMKTSDTSSALQDSLTHLGRFCSAMIRLNVWNLLTCPMVIESWRVDQKIITLTEWYRNDNLAKEVTHCELCYIESRRAFTHCSHL